jgi:hypothetical protein
MDPRFLLIVITIGLFGSLIAIIARSIEKRKRGWVSTATILFCDFTFREYATINLVSLIYAGAVGFLTAAGIGFGAFGIISPDYRLLYINSSLLCFILVPVFRISAEGYAVVFKTARDISLFARLSSQSLIKNDPDLGEIADFAPANDKERKKTAISEILNAFD